MNINIKRIFLLIIILGISTLILIAKENKDHNEDFDYDIVVLNRTDGTVDFQIRTISYNGAYAPAHCLAIWVSDENDEFILQENFESFKQELSGVLSTMQR